MNVIQGDCRKTLRALPPQCFHCCVTSPPYFGLRDYGAEGQIGLEPTPDEFVAAMVDVFDKVWRVLRDDGVLWLNLGDSYAGSWGNYGVQNRGKGKQRPIVSGSRVERPAWDERTTFRPAAANGFTDSGIKPKDLCGIPWRVAFALQSAGWFLRDAIIWHKPAPMPGSQRDRCTASYEFIFQLTKKPRYYFDLEAIKEPLKATSYSRLAQDVDGQQGSDRANGGAKTNGTMKAVCFGGSKGGGEHGSARRLYSGNEWSPASLSTPRNVWRIASEGCKDAHFATFPVELPTRCIKASTSAYGCCPTCGAPWERITERTKLRRKRPNELTKRTGESGTGNHCANTVAGVEAVTHGWRPTCTCGREDVAPCRVLDPFNGAGTTAIACRRLGVRYVGCELNPDYIEITHKRLRREANRGGAVPQHSSAAGQMTMF